MSQTSRPKVWSNFAITLDGKISTRNLTPASFTSKEDKKRLTQIRAGADAIMVGRATLVKDNMAMGLPNAELRAARIARGQREYPLRVIISNAGVVPANLRVFEKMVAPVVIFTTEKMPESNRAELANLATIHYAKGEHVDLPEVLHVLAEQFEVRSVCCEGGPTLFRAMLEAELIDELYLTLAPTLFGGKEAPTLTGADARFLTNETRLELLQSEQAGDELFLKYRIFTSIDR